MEQTDIAKYQSSYHLADNTAAYEPARNNAFKFVVSNDLNKLLFAGLSNSIDHDDNDYLSNVQDIITLSVSEAFIPHFSLDAIEIKRGNSKVKYVGTPSFEAGTLKLNDYVGARTKDALLAWQALAYNVVDDVVNTADKYKYDCKLFEYSSDYSKLLRTWTLKGCWISKISENSFTHESSDKRSIDVTIEYDRAIPDTTSSGSDLYGTTESL